MTPNWSRRFYSRLLMFVDGKNNKEKKRYAAQGSSMKGKQ